MRRKKIGVFIGGVTQNFSSRVCRAISKKAEEYGYDVYYFTTFNSYGDNLLYGEGEQQILNLPDYSTLDGIIVAPDTLNIPDGEQAFMQRLRKVACPVVFLRVYTDEFYNVLVDETTSMEHMIRHFIEVHKFRDICFMTGRMNLKDANERYDCYRRIMEEHGIPVTKDMVFFGDYWKNKGEEAVEYFLANRIDSFPEAIVCANDYMAISVCMALEERGIRVPEDVCVSGFDDLLEAQRCIPPLSSVSVPFEDMAVRAVDLIDEIDRGERPAKNQYVTVQDKYRGSCGCMRHKVKNESYNLTKEVEEWKDINLQTVFMNADLEGVTDEKALLTMVHKYNYRNNGKKMWVCYCNEEEELTEEERNLGGTRTEYTKTMILRSVKSPSGALHLMEKKFDRSELIPEEERSEIPSGSFYFVPLHYKNHNLGYVALTHEGYGHYNGFMQSWVMNFAVALEHYRLHQNLDAMQHIKRLYKEDPLTGISNRRGFEEQARKVYGDATYVKQGVAVISVDMDNLKIINDVYGHQAGDDALCRVANALVAVANENTAYARTGGDEFCVVRRIGKPGDGDEFIVQLREALKHINEQSNPAYIAEVSCGVCEVEDPGNTSLKRALEMSDEQMYEDKRKRKACRMD
ncbi:MAG: GGDEF domain-containing protein [Lachnospiraceae bacterium]|nr:GGDEF domain-containing protein [Lachnospiraceae bacterium]